MTVNITYLGPQGTFCGEAAQAWARSAPTIKKSALLPLATLEDIVASVGQNGDTFGVVPLENSREGSVGLTLDLLAEARGIRICGEVIIPVAHYLFAPPGIAAEEIEEIHSHPQALAQSRPFILQKFPGIKEVPHLSTAEAVADVARRGGRKGALGARGSGSLYGLEMLMPVEGRSCLNNKTRFIVLGKEDSPPTGRDKTSLLFTVEAGPGRLYHILELFAREEIDLCKIESRPTKKELGEYIFFLDFVGHRLEAKAAPVLEEVKRRAPYVKILGSYPAYIERSEANNNSKLDAKIK